MTFKEIRNSSGLTQKELSLKLGVLQQSISKWEKKKGRPQLEKIIDLSKILKVPLNDLIKCFEKGCE